MLILLVLLSLVILSLPSLLRDNNYLIGKEPYYNLRLSEMNTPTDELMQRSILEFNTLPSIVAYSSKVLNTSPEVMSKIIPLIFGSLFTILFYLILLYFKKPLLASLSTLLLIISPPFIYLFSTLNTHAITLTLTIFAINLVLNKRYKLSIIPLLIIPLFGFINTLFSFLILLILTIFHDKKYLYYFKFTLVISVLIILIKVVPIRISEGIPLMLTFNPYPFLLRSFFSDLGGEFGLGIFSLLLSIVGLGVLWQKKYRYFSIYLTIILLAILSIFIKPSIFYLNLFIIPLGTLGLISLYQRKWFSKTIRNYTLLIIILGIIFSTISYINILSDSQPDENLYNALIFLRDLNQDKELVFSHPSRGYWINYIGDSPALLDSKYYLTSNVNEKYDDTIILLNSRHLETSQQILDKYNIKYIFIDKEMKEGLVWNEKGEGLLFILEHSKLFKREYQEGSMEIWSYNPQ